MEKGFQTVKKQVAIIMGSRSDAKIMNAAAKVLKTFEVGYEIKIVSAHRTPEFMQEYALAAAARGVKVIIAGAGGAAHLPGMVASLTHLPVIGVPVALSALKGLDSLLSIAQMPSGVPVATVAIDNAHNAGLLAVRILALGQPRLARELARHRRGMKTKVRDQQMTLRKFLR
jgi:5-(carboxyamino)imidazole ribonucleotide mutase